MNVNHFRIYLISCVNIAIYLKRHKQQNGKNAVMEIFRKVDKALSVIFVNQ